MRNSLDGAFNSTTDLTDGSFDQPYIKAATNGNTDMAKCTANGFRLSESYEWELAARYIADVDGDWDITDTGEFYPGDYASGADRDYQGNGSGDIDGDGDEDTIDEVSVYDDSVVTSTAVVKSKKANQLGLYDMSGNGGEYCFDWKISGSTRVYRGGGYSLLWASVQVGQELSEAPYRPLDRYGLRIPRNP